MADWDEIVRAALQKLGADSVMVTGAKLRHEIDIVSADTDFHLQDHLRMSPLTFSQLVEAAEGVTVVRRPGTDMLVGFDGAKMPLATGPKNSRRLLGTGLRKDVYGAFTRVTIVPFAYEPATDQFKPMDEAEGRTVQVPQRTFDDLVEDRRRFAGTLSTEVRERIEQGLAHTTQPLGEFQTLVGKLRIARDWHAFHMERLRELIGTWATDNNLVIRDSWFERSSSSRRTAQAVLARLARHMTEDEIRGLRIPFRAIVELLESDEQD